MEWMGVSQNIWLPDTAISVVDFRAKNRDEFIVFWDSRGL